MPKSQSYRFITFSDQFEFTEEEKNQLEGNQTEKLKVHCQRERERESALWI